ncbi:MAG TPA: class I fructose-bisphosphate aldolase [Geopsychrobacteraceae bacterium]|nr:class I fructose-bisphosphate aldolase [Geopsychrobacteraceae bacterium]
MTTKKNLQQTIDDMVDDRRGVLAADESSPTIKKRFETINLESTEENRRAYRSLLLETPGLGDFIGGVILFEETLNQKNAAGTPLAEVAWKQKIVPGIKVDKGTEKLVGSPGDLITKGLDGLADRLATYVELGARFAKWREVYPITTINPTQLGLRANADRLAHYAATCQDEGVVPIVEPEVLMDGSHDIGRCEEVTEQVLHALFGALRNYGVTLEHMILKPNMVLPGKDCRIASPDEIASATIRVFRRVVPAAVPSINFLSGGQSPEEATINLNAINHIGGPWQLSISYGRALQQPVLEYWQGKAENVELAQSALLKRARLNSLARQGKYTPDMEAD